MFLAYNSGNYLHSFHNYSLFTSTIIILLYILITQQSISRINLPIQLPHTSNEIKNKTQCSIDNKEVKQHNIPLPNTLTKHRAMMIILLTTLITKRTMLSTNIPIDLTRHTVNPLLWKRLLLVIKHSPRVKEEQCRIQ